MIDPLLSLAFAFHSNPGAYALLVGSGLSTAAGIPTGWDVVLDLIRKLARLKGEDGEPDPAEWYRKTFGAAPDYSRLLNDIAPTQAERSQLLRGYFEPSEDEAKRGLKVPTKAHHAIARMAHQNRIRVIITTNFDRLIESALEAEGVVATTLSTPDAVAGALPLIHQRCCVIKVHGDYLDPRIKNTTDEVSVFDPPVNGLLDRVLDEFGLVVCGWSAEWDIALRAALERCPSRRFTTYWTSRSDPKEKAKALVERRAAAVVRIRDADSFFEELDEKIVNLDESAAPHPLSTKMASVAIKRYIAVESDRIRLNDLVMREVERLYAAVSDDKFAAQGIQVTTDEFNRRERTYRGLSEILQSIMVTGCHWGGAGHRGLWVRALERLANPIGGWSGYRAWLKFRYYPALLTLYAGGVAALAARNYETVAELLTKPKVRGTDGESSLIRSVNVVSVIEGDLAKHLPGKERRKTPMSDHLCEFLRELLREYLPDENQYVRMFDSFEYVLALVYADLDERDSGDYWAPMGGFCWREGLLDHASPGMADIEKEIEAQRENWPLIKMGLFRGSLDRLVAVRKGIAPLIQRVRHS